MAVDKKEFDRIKGIGEKLKDIFVRDGINIFGMEDYLVRSVEEATRLTKRAPDAGDSGENLRQFSSLSISPVGRLRRPRPSAGNANRSADRSEMLFSGEKEAIQTVLALGAKYGYGNLIAHLRRAWALSLKSKYGGTYEQHLPATNSDAYPENLGIE